MLATTVDFLKESGEVLSSWRGRLYAAIHVAYRLTRTSCSRCPCGSTTFQENLTVSAASTPRGAVLFCWKPPATTWKVWGYEKLVLLLIPTLWKVCGYGKLVFLLIPTLWKVCGYEKLVLLLIPTLWKIYRYEKLILLPQIVKNGRYNKGTLYSKMPTVGVLCFGSIQKKCVVRY